MKQRSREINIFSISALDLFASALGAFILLSLVFVVFFTMTAKTPAPAAPEPAPTQCPEVPTPPAAECPEPTPPSPETAEALAQTQAELAACQAQLANSQAEKQALAAHCAAVEQQVGALERAMSELRIPPLDIVICMDITGSMAGQIEGLKQEIDDLARVLDRLAPSVGIGIVTYGDRLFDRVIEKHPIVRTDTMGSLRRFVQALEPKRTTMFRYHNPDFPEALERGLAEAVAQNWRPESERRYIIVIGDAAAYPEKEAIAFARAARFAETPGQHVSAVMVARRDAVAFFRQLATAGRGEFVDGVGGQSMIASVLLAILDV